MRDANTGFVSNGRAIQIWKVGVGGGEVVWAAERRLEMDGDRWRSRLEMIREDGEWLGMSGFR